MIRKRADLTIKVPKFWARVDKTPFCWNWTGATDRSGYGTLTYVSAQDGKRHDVAAHRASYMLTHGDIPEGALIDHRCHNKACVNPKHLRPASRKQNNENREGAQVNSKSGVRGVVYHPESGKWTAHAMHRKKAKNLGTFRSLESAQQAARAYRNSVFTHNDADRRVAP